jgi:hypothetical protein
MHAIGDPIVGPAGTGPFATLVGRRILHGCAVRAGA